MRFLVEVNALGQTEAKRYGIEADTWQRALQDTRKLRGEDGPISGFSIELLDDGCRAVDPMARLRYIVKKGDASLGLGPLPDGAATVTVRPNANASTSAPSAPSSGPTKAALPRPSPSVASNKPPAAREVSVPPRSQRIDPRAEPTSVPPPAAAPAAPPRASAAPPAPAAAPAAPAAPVVPPAPMTQPMLPQEPVAARSAAAVPPPAPSSSKPAMREGLTVISRREQAPTSAVPLYYREESVLVGGNLSDKEIEAVLRKHLATLDAELARKPRGKYVQIAAFDAPPPNPRTKPLVVLAYKDWKGNEPTFTYPRKTASLAPPPVQPVIQAVHAPVPASFVPQQPPTSTVTNQALLRAEGARADAGVRIPTPAPSGIPLARPSSSGGFSVVKRGGDKRVPGEDLVAQLFEEMHGMHFLADALEAGHFCLFVAMEKLPSHAAYVHLYDIDKREFVVVCTRGSGTEVLLLERTNENDSLISLAMRKRRAITLNDPNDDSGMSSPRFSHLGGAKRIIVSPVMQAGRFLGAIELVNPLDGQPFTELEANALTYMAEQYAEFVAARGVVFEAEKVSRASQAARA